MEAQASSIPEALVVVNHPPVTTLMCGAGFFEGRAAGRRAIPEALLVVNHPLVTSSYPGTPPHSPPHPDWTPTNQTAASPAATVSHPIHR
eukprot:166161-Pyramimonas_sp.AAC.1